VILRLWAQGSKIQSKPEGQLITNEIHHQSLVVDGKLVSDIENDILKMAAVKRYQNTK
jgi:adenine deaminase